MVSCSVIGCGSNSYRIKKEALKVKLHAVPKDYRQKKWIQFCGRKETDTRMFICSNHFRSVDYHNIESPDIRRHVLVRDGMLKSYKISKLLKYVLCVYFFSYPIDKTPRSRASIGKKHSGIQKGTERAGR